MKSVFLRYKHDVGQDDRAPMTQVHDRGAYIGLEGRSQDINSNDVVTDTTWPV